ncbi:MAG: RNA polymerase sigma factor [Odoribacter splanchnicus]
MNKTAHLYITRILNGEVDLFGQLLAVYSRPIFLLIYRIVHNREEAEELTQDTFLKAYRTLHRFKGECLFSTWLYRIAYNTAISATRKKKYEFLYIEEQMIDQVKDSELDEQFENQMHEQQLDQLDKAMNSLPPDERALLLLYYTEQKTIEEIAGITKLTTANVKVKLHRIRKKLYILLNN